MIAIKFVPDNFAEIASVPTLMQMPAEALQKQYDEYQTLERQYYYCPVYTTKFGYETKSWAMIREDMFESDFDFDHDQINTKFVEITRK